MLTREDLQKSKIEDLPKVVEEELVKEAEVIASMTKEDCLSKEDELMKLMDEDVEYTKTIIYPLPKEVVTDGTTYSKSKIADIIIRALNKLEVNWQMTLGMYQLVKFWKTAANEETIPHSAYDSTLRILGENIKYKGFTEWKEILAANEYLHPIHQAYTHNIGYTYYLSAYHNALINRMNEIDPPKKDVEKEPAE